MSQQIVLGKITLVAGEDLSDKMYYLVKLDSDGNAVLCGSNEVAIGILDGKPKAGERSAVNILGTSQVVAGGEISVGSKVISDANGKAVALPTDAGTYNVIGIALQSADSDGEIIEILIRPETVVISS
jgi:hypothetical protein